MEIRCLSCRRNRACIRKRTAIRESHTECTVDRATYNANTCSARKSEVHRNILISLTIQIFSDGLRIFIICMLTLMSRILRIDFAIPVISRELVSTCFTVLQPPLFICSHWFRIHKFSSIKFVIIGEDSVYLSGRTIFPNRRRNRCRSFFQSRYNTFIVYRHDIFSIAFVLNRKARQILRSNRSLIVDGQRKCRRR